MKCVPIVKCNVKSQKKDQRTHYFGFILIRRILQKEKDMSDNIHLLCYNSITHLQSHCIISIKDPAEESKRWQFSFWGGLYLYGLSLLGLKTCIIENLKRASNKNSKCESVITPAFYSCFYFTLSRQFSYCDAAEWSELTENCRFELLN